MTFEIEDIVIVVTVLAFAHVVWAASYWVAWVAIPVVLIGLLLALTNIYHSRKR